MNYLKQCREESGLTQREVSERLGYTTPQFVSNWERSVSSPPLKTLRKLSGIYGVVEDQLFNSHLNSVLKKTERDLRRQFYGRRK